MTLIPAYGRDYKSAADVLKDWLAGKDFLIQDISHPYNGSYCSVREVDETVRIRYNKLTKVCFIKPNNA